MVDFLNKADETNAIPNLVGIKFSSINLVEGSACLKVANGKFAIFLGANQTMAGALTLGFDSFIATSINVIPEYSVQIFETFRKNGEINLAKIRRNQEVITKFMECILKHGHLISSMKVAMNIFSPVNVGSPRILVPLTDEKIEKLKTELTALLGK